MKKARAKSRINSPPKASTITRGLVTPKKINEPLTEVQILEGMLKNIEVLEQTLLVELYFLSRSSSSREFYSRLAMIIRQSHRLTEQERTYLAELVEKPWTGRKGRKGPAVKEDRHIAIFNKYIVAGVTWSKAVTDIQTEYGLTKDAAIKALQASKSYMNSLVKALDERTLGKF